MKIKIGDRLLVSDYGYIGERQVQRISAKTIETGSEKRGRPEQYRIFTTEASEKLKSFESQEKELRKQINAISQEKWAYWNTLEKVEI